MLTDSVVLRAPSIEIDSANGVANQWTAKICSVWQSGVDSIFECGRLLSAAKADLPHGEFQNMISRELPFGPPTARKLMAIASDTRLANRAHVHVLPPHWGTLYELTKLDDDALAQKFEDG